MDLDPCFVFQDTTVKPKMPVPWSVWDRIVLEMFPWHGQVLGQVFFFASGFESLFRTIPHRVSCFIVLPTGPFGRHPPSKSQVLRVRETLLAARTRRYRQREVLMDQKQWENAWTRVEWAPNQST